MLHLPRMTPTQSGSIKLFRFAGIDVFLHWSWFLAAIILINVRQSAYDSVVWNILEYLALFVIVLLHEFGHSLACRQVGGQANQIVLWPLGGVAYVAPPPRPGATLWSIAAGPLVNVVLVPVIAGVWFVARHFGWFEVMPNLFEFIQVIFMINLGILIFNLLPVFPLDGGQILWSLLWFVLGRARSLMVATIIGFVGVAGLLVIALLRGSAWMGILCVFIAMSCWRGFQRARAMLRVERLPRHSGYACPSCRVPPPVGAFWLCANCYQPFDTFASQGFCPRCAARYEMTQCMNCGMSRSIDEWITGPALPPKIR